MRHARALVVLLAACGDDTAAVDDGDAGLDPAACTSTRVFQVNGRGLGGPALAVNTSGAALTWIDTPAPLTEPLTGHLQRLTLAGAPVGAPVTVTVDVMNGSAIAADSDGFVWCYGQAAQTLQCQKLGISTGATVGLVDYASLPRLAFGSGGTLLTDIGALYITGDVRVRTLDNAANGSSPVTIASVGRLPPTLELVATASGYALVTGANRGALTVTRIDPRGSAVGTPILLDPLWRGYQLAVAASGDDVMVLWDDEVTDSVVAKIVSASDEISDETVVATSGQGFAFVGAAGGPDGFGVTWTDFAGYIGFRAFTAAGAPVGRAGLAVSTGWTSNPHTIVPVAGGYWIAVARAPVSDSIDVVHVDCAM